MTSKDDAITHTSPGGLPQLAEKPAPPSWNDIGEGFEVLGKVGLAMAIGFSAAGLFCRLAEQGRVRVPSLSTLVLNPPPRTESTRQEPS